MGDYHEEQERKQREETTKREQAVGAAQGGLFLTILLIVPIILAKIAGLIIGLCLKIGIVGRVILTAVFVFFLWMLLIIVSHDIVGKLPSLKNDIPTAREGETYYTWQGEMPLTRDGFLDYTRTRMLEGAELEAHLINEEKMLNLRTSIRTILNFVSLVLAVLVGIFWFWRMHYPVIKNIPIGIFSEWFKICFAVCFFGTIVLGIILTFFIKIGTGNTGFNVAMALSFAVAFIYWLRKTKEYANAA